jgi:hypothetical protein
MQWLLGPQQCTTASSFLFPSIMSNLAKDNDDAAVTWESFFDDEYQDDLDGFDGAIGRDLDGVEQQLLNDSSRVTDSDDKGPHVEPATAEAGRDTDSWNGFDDLLREGIPIFYGEPSCQRRSMSKMLPILKAFSH